MGYQSEMTAKRLPEQGVPPAPRRGCFAERARPVKSGFLGENTLISLVEYREQHAERTRKSAQERHKQAPEARLTGKNYPRQTPSDAL